MKMALILWGCFALLLCSCGKDITTVNGIVVDKVTGTPVADAYIEIKEYVDEDSPQPIKHMLRSRSDGNFTFSSRDRFSIWLINSGTSNYVQRYPKITLIEGQENEITIELLPLDCNLTLHIKNSTGNTNKAYFFLHNKTYSAQLFDGTSISATSYLFTNIPKLIERDSAFSQVNRLNSGEYTYIYFDTLPWTATHKLVLIDSVFLQKGDSLEYLIEF